MRMSIVIVLLGAGCSKSGGISSFDDTRMITGLSLDETKRYCLEIEAYRKHHDEHALKARIHCGLLGLMAASAGTTADEARAICKKERDQCLALPPEPAHEQDCTTPKFRDEMAPCRDLTIGEMNACFLESHALLVATVDQDPCPDLAPKGASFQNDRWYDKLLGPTCKAVEVKCKLASKQAAPVHGAE